MEASEVVNEAFVSLLWVMSFLYGGLFLLTSSARGRLLGGLVVGLVVVLASTGCVGPAGSVPSNFSDHRSAYQTQQRGKQCLATVIARWANRGEGSSEVAGVTLADNIAAESCHPTMRGAVAATIRLGYAEGAFRIRTVEGLVASLEWDPVVFGFPLYDGMLYTFTGYWDATGRKGKGHALLVVAYRNGTFYSENPVERCRALIPMDEDTVRFLLSQPETTAVQMLREGGG